MNKKIASMTALMGVALGASAVLSPASFAETGFSATSLTSGYTLAHNHAGKTDGEHKCGDAKHGEGKCAAEHKKSDSEYKCDDANCPLNHKKTEGEGKCGEGKCGAEHKKTDAEGKCGEGKCGSDKTAG